jgi:hypothetical protein
MTVNKDDPPQCDPFGGVLTKAEIKAESGDWVEMEVCYCRAGFVGADCRRQVPISCYIEITDPPISNPPAECLNRPDSDEYMYSASGYVPCFEMERGPGNHLEFKLNCSSKFWEDEGAHIPEEHRILEKPEFEYIIFDRERNLALTTQD